MKVHFRVSETSLFTADPDVSDSFLDHCFCLFL